MDTKNKFLRYVCFRVLKTNFSARPAYVSERNHIIGHFITCYTALLVFRLLETKLDQYGTHFTTEQILDTLKTMNVQNFQDTFYASAFTESDVSIALNAVFELGLSKKYHQPKDLNKKLKKLLKQESPYNILEAKQNPAMRYVSTYSGILSFSKC
ncbi:MAG: hypothetical protein Q4G19_01275 [Clostridia bacterium]|nr:hypothetical protein [Clostridia bacterium]